jgi:hypothetical protein
MKCAGCENEVPPKPEGMGGTPRKFCSANCRKRTHERQIGGTCPDCGGGLRRASVYKGSERCGDCERAGRRRRWEARALIVADLWEDGLTSWEIADIYGWSYDRVGVEMARIRQWRPELLPHRRSPEAVANIRAGWARAREAA